MTFLNIVISDKAWILERLAKEISHRLSYVRYDENISLSCDMQYYMTYSRWEGKKSKVELAYFAHIEEDEFARERFFHVSSAVDYCICHSKPCEIILRDHGISSVSTISPGVDLDELKPVVKIGVVGRTYHTGRKGENLVRQVMDIPGIDWHFTGDGWPGPARRIIDGDMGSFYNAMDYILVPSLYEGGPMSVVEALACGCPVIAPPVGWVSEFPHLEYRTGDAADLRRILTKVVAEKSVLRASVLDRTWDAWAEGHDRLFSKLAAEHGIEIRSSKSKHADKHGKVVLALHGDEAISLGGPSIRVPLTVQRLAKLGYNAETISFSRGVSLEADLVHGFNVWPPESAMELAESATDSGTPFVFSSIFLDLSEQEFWQRLLLSLFEAEGDADRIDYALKRIYYRFKEDLAKGIYTGEPFPGYHQRLIEVVGMADHMIFLSEFELRSLEKIGARPKASSIVRNPVDRSIFGAADPRLFADKYGVRDYILCVARLEPRKNQLMLLHAMRDCNLPIVLIGHDVDSRYSDLLRRYKKDNIHFIGRIAPDDSLLASAIAGCKVFVLPSWSEGAPLAALEAAASGANMVLSCRSSEHEYFGSFARYCDPADPRSIRDMVLEAYHQPLSKAQKETLQEKIAESLSWDEYSQKTAVVYQKVLSQPRRHAMSRQAPSASSDRSIWFDLTSLLNFGGAATNLSCPELSLIPAMLQNTVAKVRFFAWHAQKCGFLEIPVRDLSIDDIQPYWESIASLHPQQAAIARYDHLVVCVSGAVEPSSDALSQLISQLELDLSLIVHDLAPIIFPFWFPRDQASDIQRSFETMLRASKRIFSYTDRIVSDVAEFASVRGFNLPQFDACRLAHLLLPIDGRPDGRPDSDLIAAFTSSEFILVAGSPGATLDLRLLHDLWVEMKQNKRHVTPKLVITIASGHSFEDNFRHLLEDARLCGLIFVLRDVDSSTMVWLYRHCLFTIYPSRSEGWEMPLVTSLSYGKVCVTSNSCSKASAWANLVDIISPLDFRDWLARVSMYAASRSARTSREAEIREAYKTPDWCTAGTELCEAIISGTTDGVRKPIYVPGTTIRLSEPFGAFEKSGGWRGTGESGLVACDGIAHIRLNMREAAVCSQLLSLRLRSMTDDGAVCNCLVTFNGQELGRVDLSDGRSTYVTLPVTFNLLNDQPCVEIGFIFFVRKDRLSLSDAELRKTAGGICLEEIALTAVQDFHLAGALVRSGDGVIPPCRVNNPVSIVHYHNLDDFFSIPVIRDTAWGVRSEREPLQLRLNIHERFDEDLDLLLTFRTSATPQSPENVIVTNGLGDVIGKLQASDSSIHTARLTLKASVRRASSPLVVAFLASSRLAPSALGIGHVEETFGIGLFAFSLLPVGEDPHIGVRDTDAILFAPGVPSGFGIREPAAAYLVTSTWHQLEEDGAWSIGGSGELALGLRRVPRRRFTLHIWGSPLVPVAEGNRLEIAVNGVKQGLTITPCDGNYKLEVSVDPEPLLGTWDTWPVLRVKIIASLFSSPFDNNQSWDDRVVGFFIRDFGVEGLESWHNPLEIGQEVFLGFDTRNGNVDSLQYLAQETWHYQEIDGLWSKGGVGVLVLGLDMQPDRHLTLEIFGSPLIPFSEGNMLEVSVNGVLRTVEIVPSGNQHNLRLTVVANDFLHAGMSNYELEVALLCKRTSSPAKLEESEDGRDLGFFLRSFRLSER